ncbi:MAG: Clp protease N-terminal domain-containing protein [Candidatus Kapaibacteriota bacterium]
MNFQKFTLKSQEAVKTAQEVAVNYSNQSLEPIHLLAALVQDSEGLIPAIFTKIGGNINSLKININAQLEKLPKVSGINSSNLYLSNQLAEVFDLSLKEMELMKDEFVSVEHLFIALTQVKSSAKEILSQYKIDKNTILSALKDIRGTQRVTSPNPEDKYQALKRYGRNLTDDARKGKLDPVIGREDEIRRVLQVLSRRTKNNPILIGEPGVGKTAIVDGIALRIVNGDVPEPLKSKEIIVLDTGSLVAGTSMRGQFEERIKAIVKEVIESEGQIILFIDEIHTLVGAGATEGSLDASNIIKPALSRGELHLIGATTLDEYQKYIEKDAALERRFQKVLVEPPSVEDTISILRGLKEKYEVHHGVRITDDAIIAAAKMSDRYITDRFLPDKAIDLIDEAASKIRMEIDSMPAELDSVVRRLKQLEIERQTLLRELKDNG